MLGFVSDFLGSSKQVAISTPYDPVHLTHVGFNSSTGEFTGLPKEWQQLLQDSGISRTEQERNPQAVMDIVKFYQEGGAGDVWDKMGAIAAPQLKSTEDLKSAVTCAFLSVCIGTYASYIALRPSTTKELSCTSSYCLSTSAGFTVTTHNSVRSFYIATFASFKTPSTITRPLKHCKGPQAS
jgi:hypothetical protein